MNEETKLPNLSRMTSHAKESASKLDILHAANGDFRNVSHYKMYRLLDKLQTHNRSRTSRAGTHVMCMITLMKAYKFDDKDPITVLSFIV